MGIPYELISDAIELQACNGTGHFALISLLLPLMKETAAKPDSHVRIVNVSGEAYRVAGSPDFSSLEGLNQKSWSSWGRYAQSKLANILFTNELQKCREESGCKNIYCLSLHPGVATTEISRGILQSWPLLSFLNPVSTSRWFLKTPLQGALMQLYAATSLEVEEKGLKAAFIGPIARPYAKKSLAEDKDGKLGAQYWNLCAKLMA
ncbi:hypothetical protein GYMLUDRAFT_40048, partial [Collybiopsis luxurians FD-317 M1]